MPSSPTYRRAYDTLVAIRESGGDVAVYVNRETGHMKLVNLTQHVCVGTYNRRITVKELDEDIQAAEFL